MFFHFLLCSIISCTFLLLNATGQQMLGAGKWSVLSVQQCENDADMPWNMRVRRHKVNRTHEAYDLDLTLLDDMDESYGGRAEVCTMVDGGCKHLATKEDDCLANLTRQWAAENARAGFIAAGVDPPDFPIPKGEYHVENYLLNVEDMSKQGVYGEYYGHFYVVNKDRQDVACIRGAVKYEPVEDYGVPPALYG